MTISGAGVITMWRKPSSGSWGVVASYTDTTYTGSGYVGWMTDASTTLIDSFGGGSGASVETQMDLWHSLYSIDGYFLDRASSVGGHESYYGSINADRSEERRVGKESRSR